MAKLPGTVQATLMEVGVLPHHFVEHIEDPVQWVSDENWLYSTTFEVSEAEYEGVWGIGYLWRGWLLCGGIPQWGTGGAVDNFFRSYD